MLIAFLKKNVFNQIFNLFPPTPTRGQTKDFLIFFSNFPIFFEGHGIFYPCMRRHAVVADTLARIPIGMHQYYKNIFSDIIMVYLSYTLVVQIISRKGSCGFKNTLDMNGVKTLLLNLLNSAKYICMPWWHFRPGEVSILPSSKLEFYSAFVVGCSSYSVS